MPLFSMKLSIGILIFSHVTNLTFDIKLLFALVVYTAEGNNKITSRPQTTFWFNLQCHTGQTRQSSIGETRTERVRNDAATLQIWVNTTSRGCRSVMRGVCDNCYISLLTLNLPVVYGTSHFAIVKPHVVMSVQYRWRSFIFAVAPLTTTAVRHIRCCGWQLTLIPTKF